MGLLAHAGVCVVNFCGIVGSLDCPSLYTSPINEARASTRNLPTTKSEHRFSLQMTPFVKSMFLDSSIFKATDAKERTWFEAKYSKIVFFNKNNLLGEFTVRHEISTSSATL